MRLIVLLVLTLSLAFTTGVGSAHLVLERGNVFGAVTSGVWTAWPDASGTDADPYSRAHFSRTGRLPLAPGEGLELYASSHSGPVREPLLGSCTYRIVGSVPSARLWTLSVYDEDGHLLKTKTSRYGFHARSILRSRSDQIDITLSPTVKPGNWLPSSGETLRLLLRLYDTPVTGLTLAGTETPRIVKEACL